MKKKRTAVKRTSVALLKKEVWKAFSEYIRQRDADWKGYVKCVTCQTYGPWQMFQSGHFIPGRRNSILFDERHVYAQCVSCNVFKHGNLIAYYPFMLKKVGKKVIKELEDLNKIDKQFTVPELEAKLMEIKKKTQDLHDSRTTQDIQPQIP